MGYVDFHVGSGGQRQAGRIEAAPLEEAQTDSLLLADALRNVLRGAERVLGKTSSAVQAFRKAVPEAENVRNMLEHFDAYVEGKGRHQKDGNVRPDDWRPLWVRDGDGCKVRIGPYELNVASAGEASARLTLATLEATH